MYRLKSIHTDDSQGDGVPNRQDSPRMSVLTDGVTAKGKEQCPFSTSMGVAKQLPIAVFLWHTAVANPDRRYPFPSHSLTSYQIFCRNPAVSPWYHHPCSTSYASFYRCRFLRYKLRNGTISVFSRPSDKSLLFSLLMTSINLEYTRTHHLEGRR